MVSPNDALSAVAPDRMHNTRETVQKGFSCLLCAQRKVKCDKRPTGCNNCAKAAVPCIYKTPAPPRRRKRGDREIDTATRLRVYETALRELGVDPEDLVKRDLSTRLVDENAPLVTGIPEPHIPGRLGKFENDSEVGVLVSGEGKSRYLENGIWTSLKGEFRESREILDENSDEEPFDVEGRKILEYIPACESLLFGNLISSSVVGHLHPTPVQIFKLWQLYLDNINPLVKVFHAPTVQQTISNSSGQLSDLPRNVEALLFAIYCITVGSMSDGDCIALLGQHKEIASQRFRVAAQNAFCNANLLRTSDLMVLQAFTLFVLSLQNYDARVIWHYSGIAKRIAQRIGLHRDGETLKLPPFDVEIRRRLWWQIMMLEGYAQKLAGTGTASANLMGDVKMPSNVNDSDLCSGMEGPPKARTGATEMMFFLIRCHVGAFLLRSADAHTTFDGVWHRMNTSGVPVAVKDKAIDELEELFQHKFLQYCDVSIPWHFMCNQLAKAIIFMMRFLAHSTEYHRLEINQSEKNGLFKLALQVISAQNLAYTMKEMQGFMWHVNLHFQWKAFIYLLGELRYRTTGEEVGKAWQEVAKAYEFHPSFDKELARRALPVAVSNLTLKAWEAYIATNGTCKASEPYFIQIIRSKQSRKQGATSMDSSHIPAQDPSPQSMYSKNNSHGISEYISAGIDFSQMPVWDVPEENDVPNLDSGASNLMTFDNTENMDWAIWNSLLVDFQTHDGNNLPEDLATFSLETSIDSS